MLRTVNYCSSLEHVSSVNIWKQMPTGLVYNTIDKYGLNTIFG